MVSTGAVALLLGSSVAPGIAPTLPSRFADFLEVIGFFVGLMIVFVGIDLRETPSRLHTNGLIAMVLGVVSLAWGAGFGVGLALTITGGLLAIVATPGPDWKLVPGDVQSCPECGRLIRETFTECPVCGSHLD